MERRPFMKRTLHIDASSTPSRKKGADSQHPPTTSHGPNFYLEDVSRDPSLAERSAAWLASCWPGALPGWSPGGGRAKDRYTELQPPCANGTPLQGKSPDMHGCGHGSERQRAVYVWWTAAVAAAS